MTNPQCWEIHIAARADHQCCKPFHGEVLGKGTYEVQCLGGEFTAWSFRNDRKEWLNKFQVWSPVWPAMKEFSDGRNHGSADEALRAAKPHRFEVEDEVIVLFLINDTFHDNCGGVSLSLKKIE